MNDTVRSAASIEIHRHHQQGFVAKVGYFLWHLSQMVLAMAVGMAIFIVLFRVLLTSTGYLALRTHTPFLWFTGMAVFMTVPMIALMRYQAHSWRQCAEMTGAMLVPPGTVAALVQLGVIAYPWLAVSTLPASTHITMLLGMIVLMLYRRDQYAGARLGGTRAPYPPLQNFTSQRKRRNVACP